MDWYIRFQTSQPAMHSSWPLGIFRAADVLRELAEGEDAAVSWIEEAYDWFNTNLPVPPREKIDPRAVFWFRTDAAACIAESWKLTAAFCEAGLWVRLYRTNRPGRIVYQDQFQIAAIPYWPFGRGPPALNTSQLEVKR